MKEVNEAEYVAGLNQMLHMMFGPEVGRFELSPPGSAAAQAFGLRWEGPHEHLAKAATAHLQYAQSVRLVATTRDA